MERFLTYIIVPLAMGCMFFVFMTRQRSIEGDQSPILETYDEQASVQDEIAQQTLIPPQEEATLNIPLPRMSERMILKPFGMFVSQQNSPITPERFHGYHTGVDLEIFDDEKATEVPVRAVCDGPMISKEYIQGYGGVFIQQCIVNDQMVRVLYGHVQLMSVAQQEGDQVARGDHIGLLGAAYSVETDGERKHLHLSVYDRDVRDVRGYVQDVHDLDLWRDPCTMIHCVQHEYISS